MKIAKEAANRWTENIFSLQSYAANTYMMPQEDFYKSFEIPTEIDYVQ